VRIAIQNPQSTPRLPPHRKNRQIYEYDAPFFLPLWRLIFKWPPLSSFFELILGFLFPCWCNRCNLAAFAASFASSLTVLPLFFACIVRWIAVGHHDGARRGVHTCTLRIGNLAQADGVAEADRGSDRGGTISDMRAE